MPERPRTARAPGAAPLLQSALQCAWRLRGLLPRAGARSGAPALWGGRDQRIYLAPF